MEQRKANVIVGGEKSDTFLLENMVFQGTVLGPILWILFFGDARRAIQMLKFVEIIFADDLNVFRTFKNCVKNAGIVQVAKKCQDRLHEWGRANQTEFDPSKESITILSRQDPFGTGFQIFNIFFDPGLYMDEAISNLCDKASWKLRTLLRTNRFFGTIQMVNLYKSKVLGYIEGKTSAIYHTASSLRLRVHKIQTHFIKCAGVTEVDALCKFRLAPLSARCDMAMLAIIHRSIIGCGEGSLKNNEGLRKLKNLTLSFVTSQFF